MTFTLTLPKKKIFKNHTTNQIIVCVPVKPILKYLELEQKKYLIYPKSIEISFPDGFEIKERKTRERRNSQGIVKSKVKVSQINPNQLKKGMSEER